MARKPTPETPKPTQLSEWTPDWIQYLNETNAFKRPQDDPDFPLIQRAQLLRNELKAKAGINRLFGNVQTDAGAAQTIKDLINALIGREYLIKSQNAKNYRGEPRPKKTTPTNRSLTIESMHIWRVNGHTLDQFIESAKNDSIEALSMEESAKDNKRIFKLTWDSLIQKEKSDNKSTPHSTLEKWWAAAKTKPKPI